MKRPHITHYSLIEASRDWQRPITDVVQMAGNGLFSALVVADAWQASGQLLEGWVELEAKALLKSLTSASVTVARVKQGGQCHTLDSPQTLYWGAVFVDGATLERFGGERKPEPGSNGPADSLLTAKEVARRLGIQPDTLNKWRQQGKGPQFQKMGGTVRYKEVDVEHYVKNTGSRPVKS